MRKRWEEGLRRKAEERGRRIGEAAQRKAQANAAAAKKKKDEEDAFNKYDKDKDAKLSPAEVKAFAKEALEFDTTQDAVDRIMKACGKDGFGPLANFGRCKAMCGIAKDDVRGREKRKEAATRRSR